MYEYTGQQTKMFPKSAKSMVESTRLFVIGEITKPDDVYCPFPLF